jgi:uncharacterized protein
MRPVPSSSSCLGRLDGVYRYPVKSLVGESLRAALVAERGLVGDRLWCVQDADGKFGSGKSSRRFRKMDGLLSLNARYDGATPVIELADGTEHRGDDPAVHAALSTLVGRGVRLSREGQVSHFDEGPLHLLTTSALDRLGRAHGAPVDVRRFRPNLVVDTLDRQGFPEDTWVGRHLTVGDEVVLAIRAPMPRCVMVDLAQRELDPAPGLLRTVTEVNDANVGVVADVVRGGQVAVGDEVHAV